MEETASQRCRDENNMEAADEKDKLISKLISDVILMHMNIGQGVEQINKYCLFLISDEMGDLQN